MQAGRRFCEEILQTAVDKANEEAAKATEKQSGLIATELWDDGIHDVERIARLTRLPLDEVRKMFEGKSA